MKEGFLEDFTVGQTFGSGRLRIDAEGIKRFAVEFDPQPFHLDEQAARRTIFGGLAASGWHTKALAMRLLVESEFKPAGGLVGASFDELRWPHPVRLGDELRVETEVLEINPSKSRPELGFIKIRVTTLNQAGEAVQIYIANIVVFLACNPNPASGLLLPEFVARPFRVPLAADRFPSGTPGETF